MIQFLTLMERKINLFIYFIVKEEKNYNFFFNKLLNNKIKEMDFDFKFGNRNHKIDCCYYQDVCSAAELLEKVKTEPKILMIPGPLVIYF